MKVSTAISLLQELPIDAEICAQWYDIEDMNVMGVAGEEKLTDEEWRLAVAIFNKFEFPDMYDLVCEAVHEAKQRLAKEQN
jgi:hypothetical protein